MKSIALERPVPKAHGTFVLPRVSSEVPLVIGGEAIAYQSLAKFSLAAEKVGMALPGGPFTKLETIVKDQIQGWLEKQIGPKARETLRGQPSLIANSDGIEFFMNALSDLELLRLKPIVDALEANVAGLGWYVVDVIEKSHGRGIGLYSPASMGYHSYHYFCGAESDEEFVKQMRAQVGEDGEENPSPEKMEELIEQARNDYAYLPSSMLNSVDGHAHLLGWASPEGKPKRKYLKSKHVASLLKKTDLWEPLRQCVLDAIALDRIYSTSKGAYSWDFSNDEDEMEPIGAACFIAWNSADMLFELIQHHEENTYNSGTAIECLCRLKVAAGATPEEFENFARMLRTYFLQWNALGILLSHFADQQENQNGNS